MVGENGLAYFVSECAEKSFVTCGKVERDIMVWNHKMYLDRPLLVKRYDTQHNDTQNDFTHK